MEFPRQEYWSGLPFPPPGCLPDPGIEPGSRLSPMLAGRFFTTESPGTHLSKGKYGISISGSRRLSQTGSCYLDLGVLTCMNSNYPETVNCQPSAMVQTSSPKPAYPSASAGDAGDRGSIPGSERSPGGGNGNPLQYSCLENPTDRGAWWATVHGVTKESDMT